MHIHARWYPPEWLEVFEKDGPKEGAALERSANGYHIRARHIVHAFDEREEKLIAGVNARRLLRVDRVPT